MVKNENDLCPKCGGQTKYYDYVIRTVKIPDGKKIKMLLSRVKCVECKSVHRVIPEDLIPYKQYSKQVVESTEEYLDYPSESTVKRWARKKRNAYNGKDDT